MLLSLNRIPETVIPGFKGGTGRTCARIYADESNKLMHGLLPPGASLGAQVHETSSEIISISSASLAGRSPGIVFFTADMALPNSTAR